MVYVTGGNLNFADNKNVAEAVAWQDAMPAVQYAVSLYRNIL